jgi:thiamine biosynthesis protein ThiC
MPLSLTDMAYRVYTHTIPEDNTDFSCNGPMLKVLLALDGHANLAAIAKQIGLPINTVVAAVNRLLSQKLIKPAEGVAVYLNSSFMDTMRAEMSKAVGPIAEIIIEDIVADLGITIQTVPIYRAAELVALLAKEINRDDQKMVFQEKMVELIKNN